MVFRLWSFYETWVDILFVNRIEQPTGPSLPSYNTNKNVFQKDLWDEFESNFYKYTFYGVGLGFLVASVFSGCYHLPCSHF